MSSKIAGSMGWLGRRLSAVSNRSIAAAQQRHAVVGASSSSSSSSLSFSTDAFNPALTGKRSNEIGSGGRGSDAGLKVAVFGATGFLGPYLCTKLGNQGFMTFIGNRGCGDEIRFLRPMFDLGRTRFTFYHPNDDESIRDVLVNADVVVNMTGKFYETWQPIQTNKFPYLGTKMNFSYHDMNVDIPRRIAKICKEMQIDHFIHMSSAAANPDSKSDWARTKYEGELAVREEFPWATIFRPTQLFGVEDHLLNWFPMVANTYRIVPLINGGKALTQPVFVDDVANALFRVIDNAADYEGKRIDCFGTQEYSYRELAEFVNDITEQHRPIVDVPEELYMPIAKILQYNRLATLKPYVYPDQQCKLWKEDYVQPLTNEEYSNSKDEVLTMADLGVTATAIEKVAFSYLHRFRNEGKFGKIDGYRD